MGIEPTNFSLQVRRITIDATGPLNLSEDNTTTFSKNVNDYFDLIDGLVDGYCPRLGHFTGDDITFMIQPTLKVGLDFTYCTFPRRRGLSVAYRLSYFI